MIQALPNPISIARGEKPIRVLYVTARYLPSVGGTESHTFEVGSRFAAAGNDVTVLTTDRTGNLKMSECCDGIQIVRVRAYPKNRDYYFAPEVYRFMRNKDWDLIHIQGYHTLVAPLAMLAARHSGLPFLLTFHSGGSSSRLRNASRKAQCLLLKSLLSDAERLIAVSNFERDYFQRALNLPRDRFSVIPNGAYLPKPTGDKRNGKNGKLIVSVGRLERYKGHHRVLEALPKVIEQFPDVKLNIVGEGPYKSALQKMARDLSISSHVEIGGLELNAREEMANLLQRADLVTLLSEYESYAIAVLEALYLQRSVLVADTSALREIVTQGVARAVPQNITPEKLAAAIVQQLREPIVPTNIYIPSWDECAGKLNHLYRSILSRK